MLNNTMHFNTHLVVIGQIKDTNVISQHTRPYFEVVVATVKQVLYVHVQKADLDVAVSVHSYGPAVVGVVGVRSGIQWGCDLTRLPHHIVTIH